LGRRDGAPQIVGDYKDFACKIGNSVVSGRLGRAAGKTPRVLGIGECPQHAVPQQRILRRKRCRIGDAIG
jgi:hypothetical protein